MNKDLTFREFGDQLKPPVGRSRVHQMRQQGLLPGAYMHGGLWWVPAGTKDPRGPVGRPWHKEKGREK